MLGREMFVIEYLQQTGRQFTAVKNVNVSVEAQAPSVVRL